jgi:hypothetical protein
MKLCVAAQYCGFVSGVNTAKYGHTHFVSTCHHDCADVAQGASDAADAKLTNSFVAVLLLMIADDDFDATHPAAFICSRGAQLWACREWWWVEVASAVGAEAKRHWHTFAATRHHLPSSDQVSEPLLQSPRAGCFPQQAHLLPENVAYFCA